MADKKWRPETIAVHTGVYKDESYNSVTTPIYPSSTFYFEKVGVTKGYDYTRTGNPTRKALEENLAAMEGGKQAWATATGMSAVTTILFLFQQGDHIITGEDIYGGTYRLFAQLAPRMGIEIEFVDMGEPEVVRKAVKSNTKALFIETPSNPLLNLVDIAEMTKIGKEHGLLSIVDNTFMTPLGQRPFDLGADVVLHSTTKYINGHSDVVGGALVAKDDAVCEQIAFLVNAMGQGCSPFDAWLVLRGVKSLIPRFRVHMENAKAIAEFLNGHPYVKKVYYPGLPDHPDHELAKRQMNGFGGMVSFDLDLDKVDVDAFFARLEIFLLAESLGGVESLIEQPWTMSHMSMGEEAMKKGGITPATIRISTGIEHADDLIADLKQGLEG